VSLAGGGDYQFERVDLSTYYAPTPGARFLMSHMGDGPFRIVGYAGHVFGGPMPYTLRWGDPAIAALQVNNRGLLTGLSDVQGYNPVHVARYDAFMTAVNGHTQNYHQTDVYDTGLDSPLLDLLNVRYLLMPTTLASDEISPNLQRSLTRAYADDRVQIFENPSVMPRAWIVHAAVQVPPELATHALVAQGFDPRNVAIIESPPPQLEVPADPSLESVEVVRYMPDRIQLNAYTPAPGLLILSEVYYPAWQARVDGQPAAVYPVDAALRGVALPAGSHSVELRYESPALIAGLIVSGFAASVFVVLAILVFSTRPGDESGEVRCKAGAVPQL
jgi:hypothetical protein